MSSRKKVPQPSGSAIGAMVPDGWYTRRDAAQLVNRDPDRLKAWHRKYLSGDKSYKDASPSGHMMAGQLKVWLYSAQDIEAMRVFVKTQKPGVKPMAS